MECISISFKSAPEEVRKCFVFSEEEKMCIRDSVHAVVVGEFSLFPYPVTQIGIINNMIGANQAGQVEGFGRGINRDSPVSGIF